MYQRPTTHHWTGRKTPPSTPPDYWYQIVQLLNLDEEQTSPILPNYALLGYAVDEGVRLNQGRTGAAQGPLEIIKKLGSLANHLGDTVVADAGAIIWGFNTLPTMQRQFGDRIAQLLRLGITHIGLGGGHDIAWAHYLGLRDFLAEHGGPKTTLGILNFDAHFDLRPADDGPTSGTPFRQILEADDGLQKIYFALGIQRAANPPSLFRAAEQHGVGCVTADACTAANVPRILELLAAFLTDIDHLYVTIDLDGFSSAYAPGVSAPSPLGFAPDFFFPVLQTILSSGKVLSLDIAEYNPTYDQDGITAKLAARIVDAIVRS